MAAWQSVGTVLSLTDICASSPDLS